MLLNCGIGEGSWACLRLQEIKPADPKGNQSWICFGNWSSNSNTLASWCKELTNWRRPWCWETLKTGEGDDRGKNGWMTSLTRWTRTWACSRSWWWTGKPGVLQSMGSQRVGHCWVTELNWVNVGLSLYASSLSPPVLFAVGSHHIFHLFYRLYNSNGC